MAFSHNNPNFRKRQQIDLDSDSEDESRAKACRTGIQDAWARFLLVEGTDESKPLSKVSPFAINKWFSGVSSSGFVSIKRLRSGTFLVDCANKEASERLKNINDPHILHVPIKISNHPTLNSSKGVIKCPELKGFSENEIKQELVNMGLGVIDVHRVKITKDSDRIETNTLFLTFATPSPPKSIKVGYLRVPVTPFVPSPLRCFRCQRYGHSSKTCNSPEICRNCGQEKHDEECTLPTKCANCKESHPANSKKCPTWIKEVQIQKVRTERKCSFSEARRLVAVDTSFSETSYAAQAARPLHQTPVVTTDAVSEMRKVMEEFMKMMMERFKALESLVTTFIQKTSSSVSPDHEKQSVNKDQTVMFQAPHPVSAPVNKVSDSKEKTKIKSSIPQPSQNTSGKAASSEKNGSSLGVGPVRDRTPRKGDRPSNSRPYPPRRSSFGTDGFSFRSGSGGGNKPFPEPTDFTSTNRYNSLSVDDDFEGT